MMIVSVVLCVTGSAVTATLAGNDVFGLYGSNETVNANGAADQVWFGQNGQGATGSAIDTINFGQPGYLFEMDGSNIVANGAGLTVAVNNDDTIAIAGNNAVVTGTGTAESITATGTGDSFTLGGDGEFASDANEIGLLTSAGGTVNVTVNSRVDVTGSAVTATLAGNDVFGLYGSNETVNANGAADQVWFGQNGQGATGSAIDTIIFAQAGYLFEMDGSNIVANGAGLTVAVNNNDTIAIAGNNAVVTGTGTAESITAMGTGDSITVSSGSITLGNGASATVNGSSNAILVGSNVTFSVVGNNNTIAFAGSSTATASGTGETYQFASGDGQDVIGAAAGSNTGVVAIGSNLTDEALWLQKVGNNLQIDVLGTNNTLTVDDWFGGGNAAAAQQFTAGGLKLDTQVSALVSAMASYAANNPSFNPTTATQMPSNSSLQSAIASAWHH